jgi:ubiquinone/menaquinone biosynthesis C-methylase UbiE
LAVFERDGINPFMQEDFWRECEDITANLIKKFTPTAGKLLDVGCGMGRLLEKLTDYKKYGMDISAAYLSYAIKSNIEVCLAKVEDMPYHDNFFDTVVCTDVLEHVLDMNSAIEQLFRVVKPGGYIVIRVPYRENLEPYLHPEYPYYMAHLRNFDEYGLRLIFEKIFNGKIVAEKKGPYLAQGNYFKWPIQMRGLGFAIRNSLRICAFFSQGLKDHFIRFIFRPVEINIVIKKL